MATKKTKFEVGMKVEWVGRGNQHRRGVITRIFAAPTSKTGEPFLALVQPEEVGIPLSAAKPAK